MTKAISFCALVLFGVALAGAKDKSGRVYQDGVLVSYRTVNTGTSCSSSGTVNGSVDNDGTISGTTSSSGGCANRVAYLYTIRTSGTTLVLRPAMTGKEMATSMATLGWGSLFMKQSVLAGQMPGVGFEISIDRGEAHVKMGKRESVYTVVAAQ